MSYNLSVIAFQPDILPFAVKARDSFPSYSTCIEFPPPPPSFLLISPPPLPSFEFIHQIVTCASSSRTSNQIHLFYIPYGEKLRCMNWVVVHFTQLQGHFPKRILGSSNRMGEANVWKAHSPFWQRAGNEDNNPQNWSKSGNESSKIWIYDPWYSIV